MRVHLIPTVAEFAAYAEALAAEVGGVPLHPDNRLTACGRGLDVRSSLVTTDPGRVTCKVCVRRAAAGWKL